MNSGSARAEDRGRKNGNGGARDGKVGGEGGNGGGSVRFEGSVEDGEREKEKQREREREAEKGWADRGKEWLVKSVRKKKSFFGRESQGKSGD